MALTLVELKDKIKGQVKELIKVEDFRVTYARFDEINNNWRISISYIIESAPDSSGRKFKFERMATLSTDPDGNVIDISTT